MTADSAIQLLRNTIRLRHYSLSTEQCYADWLRRFMRYVVKLPAGLPSERKIESFLTLLAKDDVAASTQNQAFNALLAVRSPLESLAPLEKASSFILHPSSFP